MDNSYSIEGFYRLRYGNLRLLRNYISNIDYQESPYKQVELLEVYEKIECYRNKIEIIDFKTKKNHNFYPTFFGGMFFWFFSICILPLLNWEIGWEELGKAHSDIGLVLSELVMLPVILIVCLIPIMLPAVIADLLLSLIEKNIYKTPSLSIDREIGYFLSQGMGTMGEYESVFEYNTYLDRKYNNRNIPQWVKEIYTYFAVISLILAIIMFMNATSVSYMFHGIARWFLIAVASVFTILFIIAKNPWFSITAGAIIMFIPGLVHLDSSIWSLYDIFIGVACLVMWKSKLCLFDIILLYRLDTKYKFVFDPDSLPLFLQLEKNKIKENT